ncbi:phasin family protein [Photobacterium sp. SDRW27]|uniref:phasin-related domain-containing protein n=1 Tax=Photobacterium obscurum TaxID=2829490 RepID=UPI0022430F7C|nr:phasin family protein [Photobacterium obscurum]MCW8331556.1 phasin family protein [Photobacterium obscurum]
MSTVKSAAETIVKDEKLHNIWLAGLGAYAKSTGEVSQLSDKGKSLFNELVERGRSVESEVKERVHTERTHTSVAIEERVHNLLQSCVGIDNERLDHMDDKIDLLAENIEALLASRQEKAKPEA